MVSFIPRGFEGKLIEEIRRKPRYHLLTVIKKVPAHCFGMGDEFDKENKQQEVSLMSSLSFIIPIIIGASLVILSHLKRNTGTKSPQPSSSLSTGNLIWREKWNGGIYGVFNPLTGQVEWQEKWHGDIAGVFNPLTGRVEWREKWHGGICGVYNPHTRQVEWQEKWHGGVAGVFNPLTGQVEWQEKWHRGVAGAITVFPHQMMPDLLAGMSYSSSSFYYDDDD